MFGADAPRLTRLIVQELENEAQAQRSERDRTQIPFEELTPAEQVDKYFTVRISIRSLITVLNFLCKQG